MRLRRNNGLILGLLVLLTAALRLFHLQYRSLWTDEFRTLYSIRLPLLELIRERMSYGHFPTYFILLKYWTSIFGDSEWSLRLPSLICVVVAAAFVFWTARKSWGISAATWAAIFFALNGRGIWAAQEARPYGLVILAAAASLHALVNALERVDCSRPRMRRIKNLWWIAYVFWSALGLVSHATYLFIFIGQSVVVAAWVWRKRRPRWDWFATILMLSAFAAVSYGVLGDYAARHVSKAYNEEARGLNLALFREGLLEVFWGDYRLAIGSGFKYFGMLIALGLTLLAWRAAPRKQVANEQRAPMFWLSLAWALSIILVMGAISAVKQDVVRDSRYFAPGLGGACLLMGLGVSSIRNPKWQYSIGGIVVILLAINAAGWLWSPGEQVRHAVRYVAEHRAPDEPVLFCKNTNSALMAEYYHLGTIPKGFDREELNRDTLKKQLQEYVGNAPGFWLILYKEENSPIVSVIEDWSAKTKYNETKEEQFAKVGVKHWRLK